MGWKMKKYWSEGKNEKKKNRMRDNGTYRFKAPLVPHVSVVFFIALRKEGPPWFVAALGNRGCFACRC